jgi:hypothetical protein
MQGETVYIIVLIVEFKGQRLSSRLTYYAFIVNQHAPNHPLAVIFS